MVKNLGTIKYKQEDYYKWCNQVKYKHEESENCPTLLFLSNIFAKYGFHARIKRFTNKCQNGDEYKLFQKDIKENTFFSTNDKGPCNYCV